MAALRARHLALVGMMGTGKSSVGRSCAARLGRPFVDTDELVELAAGCSVAELFVLEGEPAFRVQESGVLHEVLATPTPTVVSCGGGVVVDAANRRELRAGATVVWLRASTAELARRLGGESAARPLLGPGVSALTIERIGALREPSYRAVADASVWTDGRSVDEVAGEVLAALGAMTASETER